MVDDGDENEKSIIEEDWSNIIKPASVDDGFAYHDIIEEFLLETDHEKEEECVTVVLKIASISSLSPIDMINLSWGRHDATGHKIWSGAKLFLNAITKLKSYFSTNARILELGTGTGLSGIAINKLYSSTIQCIVLTDVSESALQLCQRNCNMNQVSNNISIQKLCWGQTLEATTELFDTVIATDVLYDLEMWKPILETATKSLREDGSIILSHVPRAALPCDEKKSLQKSLEDIIIEQATKYRFNLKLTIRPNDLSINSTEMKDMHDIGAAIFVLQKSSNSQCVLEL